MTWYEIATVAAVVRTRSLLAAARELGLRHSSVSRRLAAIEAALGERNVDRHAGGRKLDVLAVLCIEPAQEDFVTDRLAFWLRDVHAGSRG